MHRSTERIITTHDGSLARPTELLEIMRDMETGKPYDHAAFDREVRDAVADRVHRQVQCVEHPELIADWIGLYAGIVGRERVIAGAGCGFSSRATFTPEVHPDVVWAKFDALVEGARIATTRLWG